MPSSLLDNTTGLDGGVVTTGLDGGVVTTGLDGGVVTTGLDGGVVTTGLDGGVVTTGLDGGVVTTGLDGGMVTTGLDGGVVAADMTSSVRPQRNQWVTWCWKWLSTLPNAMVKIRGKEARLIERRWQNIGSHYLLPTVDRL